MNRSITVGIPTKNRYDMLSHTLLSIATQTLKPVEVIIVDDSDKVMDIRDIPVYNHILRLFDDKGISWKVLYGSKLGQHHSHQLIQEEAKGDYIFRIDDDEVAEPDVLEKLVSQLDICVNVGAVAPSVLMVGASDLPPGLSNNYISRLDTPNIQWFKSNNTVLAEHLYSCFLYKKGIAKYDLTLSPVAHREETIFSHSINRNGYILIVHSPARVWHFRAETGGIRSHRDASMYEHDEKVFQGYLNLWNVDTTGRKVIVLDNGIGDHCAFKNLLPKLKERYKELTIAACFPDIFFDEPDLKLISIAEAKLMYGDIEHFQIYKLMWDWGWKGNIVSAFERLYL